MAAYPDAKVILTLHPRGADAWDESAAETIYAPERMWQATVPKYTIPLGRKMSDMTQQLIWRRALKGTMEVRTRAVARYKEHIEEVKAAVPPARLRVFTVGRGWELLWRFLRAPVPTSRFPKLNDRAQIKKTIAGITNGAYVIFAIAALILAAAVYGVLRILA